MASTITAANLAVCFVNLLGAMATMGFGLGTTLSEKQFLCLLIGIDTAVWVGVFTGLNA